MRESIERIRQAVTTNGLKKSVLAAEAGLGVDTLTGVEEPEWNPRAKTVEALTDALDRIANRLAAA
jgi:transcriptional regulator with XRE-family HTH domain